uniref:Uncharacterized protein n=1 Tax=Haptolina brevifila TaxID=156173 RepID=A0A7S2FYA5_9EUKA|mmetsp:Transcript_23215/g.46482  ORF Transcript_23215/g.46482 Transcript_23215/m.46482 type:complete len:177 (+) Transcript_23215:3-533(+)
MTVVDATFIMRDRQLQRGNKPHAPKLNAQTNGTNTMAPNAAGSRSHLTAEGRRAAQLRQHPGEKQQRSTILHGRRAGARLSNNQPMQHESMRLRLDQEQHKAFDAENLRNEQQERQDKYAREQQYKAMVEQKIQRMMSERAAEDPNAVNGALARSIAAKQTGAAVNSILSAGYGYE